MTLQELGRILGGEVRGDGSAVIRGMRDIERLGPDKELEDGWLYFIESRSVLKRHPLAAKKGAVLTTAELAGEFRSALAAPGDARLFFIKALWHFDRKPKFAPGAASSPLVHPSAKVDPKATVLPGAMVMEGAEIGPGAVIWPGAVIEPRARIGEGSEIRPGAVIGYDCVVGRRCIVHSATAVGPDGFGFYDRPGERHKIPQIGAVVLEDDVELGASNTVDRGTIEDTVIGRQTKTDDQVHVGHNCRVGRFCYIAGNTALGGSVVMEDGVILAGHSTVKDHVRVKSGTILLGASALAQDTAGKEILFGVPARPAKEMHRINATLAKLPELVAKVKELEAALPEKNQ